MLTGLLLCSCRTRSKLLSLDFDDYGRKILVSSSFMILGFDDCSKGQNTVMLQVPPCPEAIYATD